MPDGAIVAREARERQCKARDAFAREIDGVVESFITKLYDIAKIHKRLVFFFLHRLDRQ